MANPRTGGAAVSPERKVGDEAVDGEAGFEGSEDWSGLLAALDPTLGPSALRLIWELRGADGAQVEVEGGEEGDEEGDDGEAEGGIGSVEQERKAGDWGRAGRGVLPRRRMASEKILALASSAVSWEVTVISTTMPEVLKTRST